MTYHHHYPKNKKENKVSIKGILELVTPIFLLIGVIFLGLNLTDAFVFGSIRTNRPAGSDGYIQFNNNM